LTLRIAVIDSGWDPSSRDPRVLRGVGFAPPDDDDVDRNGHGTGCIDLILDVAPAVEILPVRVFGDVLETSPDVLATALQWAVAHEARLINMSLGTLVDASAPALYRACERARGAGVVIVAAAGAADRTAYPAAFDNVLSVGFDPAVEHQGFVYRRGRAVECIAPNAVRMVRSLGGRLQSVMGTSFTTAIVTGEVARFLIDEPTASLADVRCYLQRRWGDAEAQSGIAPGST